MRCFEYSCFSRSNNTKAATAVALSMTSSAILYVISATDIAWLSYLKSVAIVFLVLSALLMTRYFGTRFMYKISFDENGKGEIEVYELRGYFGQGKTVKQASAVCRVSIENIKEAARIDRKKKSDRKNEKGIKLRVSKEKANVYNYCSEIFPSDHAYLRIEDEDGISYIKLSPDERLWSIIKMGL